MKANAERTAAINQAGVFLTFDDTYIEQWRQALPIFAAFGARATFFISQFNTLTSEQIDTLVELGSAGHAIGCHGAKHKKAVDYIERFGIDRYLHDEIRPAVRAMTDAALAPTCFSYPCSQRNETTDHALLQVFSRLRTGAALPAGQSLADADAFFVSLHELPKRRCLIGKGIDGIAPDNLSDLQSAFARAQGRDECITFYAHNISNTASSHRITPRTLEAVLELIVEQQLCFHTFDEF